MLASCTGFSRRSQLFENEKMGRRPVESRVKMPMNVFGCSSLSTNLRAAAGLLEDVPPARASCQARRELPRLLFVFHADCASRHQAERPDILADAILVDRQVFGLEIGDEVAMRVAHYQIQQYFAGRSADHNVRRLGQNIRDHQRRW